ncbi:MAG: hypothetical protein JRJ09_18565, partial [Deltaproteobacteria bacterium]|nr:hypothetical protein [Deltaproteobacteria bacterium]
MIQVACSGFILPPVERNYRLGLACSGRLKGPSICSRLKPPASAGGGSLAAISSLKDQTTKNHGKRTMGNLSREEFRLLHLNRSRHLIAEEVLFRGTVDESPIY